MKLLTYIYRTKSGGDFIETPASLGFLYQERIFPIQVLGDQFPRDMLRFLEGGKPLLVELKLAFENWVESMGGYTINSSIEWDAAGLKIKAPLLNPTSFRDAYAFRQHVETSRQNRGLEMIPEFDDFPVFYFSNHQVISGPGPVEVQLKHLEALDYELEIAIVINRKGKNISAAEADQYIGGFIILNDWSARKMQMDEMKLNLGPAKGKDFATSMGPFLVTPDSLEPFIVDPNPGHIGRAYNLEMKATVNGKLLSKGNFRSMNWTFAEIIERASYGVTLYPGDIIGSGTVGTGCLLELNGTGSRKDPQGFVPQWLKEGDVVELEIENLGVLKNTIVLTSEN